MTNAAIDIPNLLYRYANFMDAGDFKEAARLFENGSVEVDGQPVKGEQALVQLWESWVKLYEGRPLTRHLIANPIISLSENQTRARCESQWTVIQATNTLPLQPIATGRYDDELAIIDGDWQFTKRQYAGIDLAGNMSQHIKQALKKKED